MTRDDNVRKRTKREQDAAKWIANNPEKAVLVMRRALTTCIAPVTSDWLLELCRAEGFR